jgi:predicted membrane protein (TIGR00267 family)
MKLRYLALGTTDGTLIALGVVTATRQFTSLHLTLIAAAAGVLSSALSNAFGAYVAESAETGEELSEYARHMVVPSLSSTAVGRAYRSRIHADAATMGVSVLLGGSVPLLPLMLLSPGILSTTAAIALTLVILFSLGAYTGARTKSGLVLTGVRTALLGVAVALLAWGIGEILAYI